MMKSRVRMTLQSGCVRSLHQLPGASKYGRHHGVIHLRTFVETLTMYFLGAEQCASDD